MKKRITILVLTMGMSLGLAGKLAPPLRSALNAGPEKAAFPALFTLSLLAEYREGVKRDGAELREWK